MQTPTGIPIRRRALPGRVAPVTVPVVPSTPAPMARTGFLWPKHLAYAVLALAVVVSLSEIGLRVYDSATGQVTRRQLYDRGLLCKSWFVHHTLRPSQVFAVKHPDRDEKIRVAINSLGYRGPEPRIPKPAGVYRVVCLGDDQTFGQAVPLDATWPARLESIWKDATPLKIEVLNAAVPGYCPLLQYLQLKLQLGSLQPDLVIAQFDPSDVAEDYACRRQLLTSADRVPLSCSHPDLYLKRGELNKPVNQPWLLPEVLKTEVAKFWTDRMLTESSKTIDSPQGKYAWIEDSPPDLDVYVDQCLAPLLRMQRHCDALGIDFVVVVQPAAWQVSPTATPGEAARAAAGIAPGAEYGGNGPSQRLREFCDEAGIALVDLTEPFRRQEESDTLFWTESPTLSDRGHELVGRTLARRLVGLLPGQPVPAAPSAVESHPDELTRKPRPNPLGGATVARPGRGGFESGTARE